MEDETLLCCVEEVIESADRVPSDDTEIDRREPCTTNSCRASRRRRRIKVSSEYINKSYISAKEREAISRSASRQRSDNDNCVGRVRNSKRFTYDWNFGGLNNPNFMFSDKSADGRTGLLGCPWYHHGSRCRSRGGTARRSQKIGAVSGLVSPSRVPFDSFVTQTKSSRLLASANQQRCNGLQKVGNKDDDDDSLSTPNEKGSRRIERKKNKEYYNDYLRRSIKQRRKQYAGASRSTSATRSVSETTKSPRKEIKEQQPAEERFIPLVPLVPVTIHPPFGPSLSLSALNYRRLLNQIREFSSPSSAASNVELKCEEGKVLCIADIILHLGGRGEGGKHDVNLSSSSLIPGGLHPTEHTLADLSLLLYELYGIPPDKQTLSATSSASSCSSDTPRRTACRKAFSPGRCRSPASSVNGLGHTYGDSGGCSGRLLDMSTSLVGNGLAISPDPTAYVTSRKKSGNGASRSRYVYTYPSGVGHHVSDENHLILEDGDTVIIHMPPLKTKVALTNHIILNGAKNDEDDGDILVPSGALSDKIVHPTVHLHLGHKDGRYAGYPFTLPSGYVVPMFFRSSRVSVGQVKKELMSIVAHRVRRAEAFYGTNYFCKTIDGSPPHFFIHNGVNNGISHDNGGISPSVNVNIKEHPSLNDSTEYPQSTSRRRSSGSTTENALFLLFPGIYPQDYEIVAWARRSDSNVPENDLLANLNLSYSYVHSVTGSNSAHNDGCTGMKPKFIANNIAKTVVLHDNFMNSFKTLPAGTPIRVQCAIVNKSKTNTKVHHPNSRRISPARPQERDLASVDGLSVDISRNNDTLDSYNEYFIRSNIRNMAMMTAQAKSSRCTSQSSSQVCAGSAAHQQHSPNDIKCVQEAMEKRNVSPQRPHQKETTEARKFDTDLHMDYTSNATIPIDLEIPKLENCSGVGKDYPSPPRVLRINVEKTANCGMLRQHPAFQQYLKQSASASGTGSAADELDTEGLKSTAEAATTTPVLPESLQLYWNGRPVYHEDLQTFELIPPHAHFEFRRALDPSSVTSKSSKPAVPRKLTGVECARVNLLYSSLKSTLARETEARKELGKLRIDLAESRKQLEMRKLVASTAIESSETYDKRINQVYSSLIKSMSREDALKKKLRVLNEVKKSEAESNMELTTNEQVINQLYRSMKKIMDAEKFCRRQLREFQGRQRDRTGVSEMAAVELSPVGSRSISGVQQQELSETPANQMMPRLNQVYSSLNKYMKRETQLKQRIFCLQNDLSEARRSISSQTSTVAAVAPSVTRLSSSHASNEKEEKEALMAALRELITREIAAVERYKASQDYAVVQQGQIDQLHAALRTQEQHIRGLQSMILDYGKIADSVKLLSLQCGDEQHIATSAKLQTPHFDRSDDYQPRYSVANDDNFLDMKSGQKYLHRHKENNASCYYYDDEGFIRYPDSILAAQTCSRDKAIHQRDYRTQTEAYPLYRQNCGSLGTPRMNISGEVKYSSLSFDSKPCLTSVSSYLKNDTVYNRHRENQELNFDLIPKVNGQQRLRSRVSELELSLERHNHLLHRSLNYLDENY